MITEVCGVNNEMINQIRLNTVAYYSWALQYSVLMSEVSDEHWGNEFLVTFYSEGRIYNMNDRFWNHLIIIFFNWFWLIQSHMSNLKLFTHLICQSLINKGIPSDADINKKFQMQTRKIINNGAICQQRFLSSNIKWIMNKRNKKNIK